MALPGNFRHGSDECYVVRGFTQIVHFRACTNLIVFICFLLLIGALNSRCLESRGTWCSLGLCNHFYLILPETQQKSQKSSAFLQHIEPCIHLRGHVF